MDKYKTIDEKISVGYRILAKGQVKKACDVLLESQEEIKALMVEDKIKDIPDLGEKYKWTEFMMNYVQDLEEELYNAAQEDAKYYSKRIRYCEELLESSGDKDELLIENNRRALAESHYALGNRMECDKLFGMWLADDPAWGWGYIGWSDCYRYGSEKNKVDYEKAEEIIKKALEEKKLRDRADVVDRAIEIYEALGKTQQAEELKKEIKELTVATKRKIVEKTPVKVVKIGRNEPCSCGSGKKYKKCCGK